LKFLTRMIVTALIMPVSTAVLAATIGTPKTVKRVFSEGSTGAGFYTVEGLPECKYSIMYLNLSTESGKAMFSQLLTAKSAGFKVVRIDYSVLASGQCVAGGLHIE